MFHRGVSPLDIEKMTYSQLKDWNGCHKAMVQAEEEAIEEAKRNK